MSSKIISNYLPELRSITAGRKHPAVVSLNITEKCNQKCVYCEIGNNIPSSTAETLDTGDLKRLIDEMHRIGIKRLAINGGEPFLFPDLIETVKYAAEKNIICAITSNGMTIHKISDTEIQILKDCKTEINISVDSMDDNIQSLTRGVVSALTNALKSAELLITAGIPVIFLTAISVYNYKDLFSSFLKIYESGINQVLYQPIIYYSNYPDRQTIENKFNLNVGEENIAELMLQLRQILKFERTHNIKTNVYRIMPWIEHYLHTASGNGKTWFWENVLKKFYCREIHAIIDITYNGGIQPCALTMPEINIKHNRSQGLLKMWETASQGIKDDMDNGRFRKYCNGCCNHFSRNMIASAMKYPFRNRKIVFKTGISVLSRFIFTIFKKLFIRN